MAVSSGLYLSLSVHLRSRSRLSCAKALTHPWMASFTPLTRRPTKSLKKEKMRRFLAKRKWKVKHQKKDYSAVFPVLDTRTSNSFDDLLNLLCDINPKLCCESSLSSSAICPLNF